MTYSATGLIAIIIHCIINIDLFHREGPLSLPWKREYRRFLLGMIFYHVTDIFWGILNDRHLTGFLYIDTVLYFIAMGLCVLLWTVFVIRYLGDNGRFAKLLKYSGRALFSGLIVLLMINFFTPILFALSRSGEYEAGVARYIFLLVQILMYFFVSLYMFLVTIRTEGASRRRHFTVGLFGIFMIAAITLQVFYPLLPLYSVGFLLGGCALHTFVIEDVKVEYINALQDALGREAKQEHELGMTRRMPYTDPLTKVKSKSAYQERMARINEEIRERQIQPFAIAVFDINELKHMNDTKGHDAGDRMILSASSIICEVVSHSPVFRIGGDEFVAILEGREYENRERLMEEFNSIIDSNQASGRVSVAAGSADYEPSLDHSYSDIFRRADHSMYIRKQQLKGEQV